MAKIELDVSELLEYRDRLMEEYHREQMLYELAREMMEKVREVAKELTPIDTGNLRKNWSHGENLFLDVVKNGNVYTVSIENKAYNARGGNKEENRFYASFVEEGYHSTSGRWIPGHWMMKTGEEEAERKAQRMFNAIVKDWVRWLDGGK